MLGKFAIYRKDSLLPKGILRSPWHLLCVNTLVLISISHKYDSGQKFRTSTKQPEKTQQSEEFVSLSQE